MLDLQPRVQREVRTCEGEKEETNTYVVGKTKQRTGRTARGVRVAHLYAYS